MNAADYYFLQTPTNYPCYSSLGPSKGASSAYTSKDAVSMCEQKCEAFSLQGNQPWHEVGAFQFNDCIVRCADLGRSKTRYGPVDAYLEK